MSWEEYLAREMGHAEDRAAQRADAIARTLAARETKIKDLWRLIDLVIARANSRVPDGRHRFQSEETDGPGPITKTVYYGGRRLLFEVEALAYDAWRNEPAFYPGGLARVFVEPHARDLTSLFCAISDDGARWLIMPTRRPLGEETIVTLLRVLLS